MIRQLAHLNFVTNDLERIIDFYVNKLGLKIKFTLDNKEGQPFGYYFECGNSTFIEFFDQAMAAKEWGGKVEALREGTRYKHFCLEIVGLDEYCAQLKSRGINVSGITLGMDNARQAWIDDPDGNSIELMEYGPTSLQLTGKKA
jgi:catechol 2,3-dioxygenase-like lactoylglutathione lyase family enzyme